MKTSDFSIEKMIWMEVLCVMFGTLQPILRVEIRLYVCLHLKFGALAHKTDEVQSDVGNFPCDHCIFPETLNPRSTC